MAEPKVPREKKVTHYSEEEISLLKELYKEIDDKGFPIISLEICKRFNSSKVAKRRLNESTLRAVLQKLLKAKELIYIDRRKNRIKNR